MPFLLDTNVVSELRHGRNAHPHVVSWRREVALEEIYISAIVMGEMRRGVELKRRRDPATARVFEKWLQDIRAVYQERILPVTDEICDIWGRLAADSGISPIDCLIAATAVRYNLTVATRNERDFQRVGVDYFNPFTGGHP